MGGSLGGSNTKGFVPTPTTGLGKCGKTMSVIASPILPPTHACTLHLHSHKCTYVHTHTHHIHTPLICAYTYTHTHAHTHTHITFHSLAHSDTHAHAHTTLTMFKVGRQFTPPPPHTHLQSITPPPLPKACLVVGTRYVVYT